MGQPVAVTEKPSSPGVVRFEAEPALTGMGHEHFTSAADAFGPDRPPSSPAGCSRPARSAVHVYSNIDHRRARQGNARAALGDIIRDLYQYWQPGMEPPAFEDPAEEAAAAPRRSDGGAVGRGPPAPEAAKRVPAHLLERSRLARERWKAKQG